MCVSGEEWQVSKVGAYLPGAHEEVVEIVSAFILTDKVPSLFFLSLSLPCLVMAIGKI